MSQIMKTFLGIFLILVIAVSDAGILSLFLTAMQAQNMHGQIICELENSNFNEQVLQECYDTAEKNNFDLQVTIYRESGDGQPYLARVKLEYPLQISFLGLKKRECICGYAY